MLLLIFFPNLSKNCFKLLNGLIAQWLNEMCDGSGFEPLFRPETKHHFLKNLLPFCYRFSSLAGCKGIDLLPNRKIVFKIFS